MRTSVYAAALALAAPVFADSKCNDVKVQNAIANIDCPTVTGDLTVPTGLGGDVQISGIKKVTGSVNVKDNQGITALTISDLTEVGDTVAIQRNNVLGNIRMDKLNTINKLSLVSLQQLATIGFGSEGNTEAKSVEVIDTSLSDLTGLNLGKVDTFKITTNSQLKMFNSDLKKIGQSLVINKNGKNMEVNMTLLQEAQEIDVAGSVASFSVPSLKKISALRFTDNPNLESFEAKNLTEVGANAKKTGSISFIGNDKLNNVSFPGVTKIFGDLTVKNNTAMTELNGFPKLETIFGALLIAGDFKDIELPKLNRIDGAATVTSTQDISKFCNDGFKTFDAQSTKNDCKGKNSNANSAKNGDTLDGSNSGDDKEDAANAAVVSMTTLAAAVFIGILQML